MTNREYLESLSDEEFATQMLHLHDCWYCSRRGSLSCLNDDEPPFTCIEGKKEWLQAEHEEDDNGDKKE